MKCTCQKDCQQSTAITGKETGAGGNKTSSFSLVTSLWRNWKSWQASGTWQGSPEERWNWLGGSVKTKQPYLDLSVDPFLQVHKGRLPGWAWHHRHSITSLCMRCAPNLTPTASSPQKSLTLTSSKACLEEQLAGGRTCCLSLWVDRAASVSSPRNEQA